MSELINEYNLISSHLRLFYFYKLDFIIQNEVFVITIPLIKGPLQLEKTTKVLRTKHQYSMEKPQEKYSTP